MFFRENVPPDQNSGDTSSQAESPRPDDSRLELIGHRRNSRTGKFKSLKLEDRQLLLPFIGRLN